MDSNFFLYPEFAPPTLESVPDSPTCTISPSTNIRDPLPISNPEVTNNSEKEKRTTTPPPQTEQIPKKEYVRHTPFSNKWVVDRLKDTPEQRALAILKTWSHPKRHREINSVTLQKINQLNDTEASKAIDELKKPQTYVRGTSNNKLALTTIVESPNTQHQYKAKTLIDCGCEGTCINQRYVDEQGLQVRKLALPISVYNYDGTINEEGAITGCVNLKLHVGDHIEEIEFGVTNLGSHDIFLGHDWLKKHNPNIDWQRGLSSVDVL